MHRRVSGGVRGWGALSLWIVLLSAATGCPPARMGIPPRDAEEALLRISDNLSGLNAPVIAKGLVSFRFRDETGNMRRFIAHPTTIVFQGPQSLYFDIKDAIGGSVARIGSNSDRYWIWIDVPDSRRLMWGEWARVADLPPERIPLPPGDLLDSLCLRPPAAAAAQRSALSCGAGMGTNGTTGSFSCGWTTPARRRRFARCSLIRIRPISRSASSIAGPMGGS
ncbi:MAG: hypothetical protein IPM64_11580 [Phycisphaerales bacterium]|nr:hypothetical protein [Phycisphaerales bacterium]